MSLMWSLFLTGHLYLSGKKANLIFGMDTNSYDDIGLCAQHIDTILGSVLTTIGRVYVII